MEQNGISVSIKELVQAYQTITRIMKENDMTMDTSFRRVQCWLSNAVCDSLKEENIIEN